MIGLSQRKKAILSAIVTVYLLSDSNDIVLHLLLLMLFSHQTYEAKSWDIYILFGANRVILSAVVLSRTTTDDRQHIMTIAKFGIAIAKFG